MISLLILFLWALILSDIASTTPLDPPDPNLPLLPICFREPCDPDWFLLRTKPGYNKTLLNRALFYTRGATETAKKLSCDASTKFYISLWQICNHPQGPNWMYSETDPRLRHVYQDLETRNSYYQNMSKAFARMARGAATSLHRPIDYLHPPTNGIFGQYEVPALAQYTDIIKLWTIQDSPSIMSAAEITSVGVYYGSVRSEVQQYAVQRNMWVTEELLLRPRLDEYGGLAPGEIVDTEQTCAFSTDPNHPLNALAGGSG